MLINKVTSLFGNHSNLTPLFTKDIINSAGMTAFCYDAGGKIEAKDRFIDEFGTQAIWMGGLPFTKFAFDKTIYKLAKFNPDIDVRLFRDKEQLEIARNFAKSLTNKPEISKTLEHFANNKTKANTLFFSKFATATALTLGAFFTLVKVKQNYTEKQIAKEYWAKKSAQTFYTNKVAQSPAFKSFTNAANPNKNTKNIGFKGSMLTALKETMFDPVKNLFIVDIGISGERLANSRTKNELVETFIKEGSLLFFLYVAGNFVQSGIEKISELMGKPIDLNAEVLSSKYLKDKIASGDVNKDVQQIKDLISNKTNLFNYIYNSPDSAENTVIKAAKQSGIINTIKEGSFIQKLFGKAKDTGIIDPHQFINIKHLDKLTDDIQKITLKTPKDTEKSIIKYLNKCRNAKIASVAANMGITCLCLGLIVPFTMMKYREKSQNGNKQFHVQSEIEKKLEQNFKARIV